MQVQVGTSAVNTTMLMVDRSEPDELERWSILQAQVWGGALDRYVGCLRHYMVFCLTHDQPRKETLVGMGQTNQLFCWKFFQFPALRSYTLGLRQAPSGGQWLHKACYTETRNDSACVNI